MGTQQDEPAHEQAEGIRLLCHACRPLRVTTRASDGKTVLGLAGELDLATAEPLNVLVDNVIANAKRRVVLDLSGLTFCDMSGLRALRLCDRTARASGVTFELTGLSDRVLWLLEVSGLMPVFAGVMPTKKRPGGRG
ncbi:hypothetical protein GCM10022224_094530 [Nonomuraea antimicrobica]|uniref:Anti-sigma factor antagonist n=2 Tax=Nonomuraea antimicrobica TaxID=561173 RepID=A0ABP7E424_9ACTN